MRHPDEQVTIFPVNISMTDSLSWKVRILTFAYTGTRRNQDKFKKILIYDAFYQQPRVLSGFNDSDSGISLNLPISSLVPEDVAVYYWLQNHAVITFLNGIYEPLEPGRKHIEFCENIISLTVQCLFHVFLGIIQKQVCDTIFEVQAGTLAHFLCPMQYITYH